MCLMNFKNLLAYFELGNSAVHINSNQIKLMLIFGGPEWKSEVLVGGGFQRRVEKIQTHQNLIQL